MAASSPRKAPARKPSTTAAQRSQQARADRVDRFEALRARAGNMDGIDLHDDVEHEDLVLGEEFGFDPEIVVSWPRDLTTQLLIDEASRADDGMAVLRILVGRQMFYSIVRAFDSAYDDKRDGIEALVGLSRLVYDHFLGRGASDVGGTAAS